MSQNPGFKIGDQVFSVVDTLDGRPTLGIYKLYEVKEDGRPVIQNGKIKVIRTSWERFYLTFEEAVEELCRQRKARGLS